MALTKVSRGLLSTGIVDNSNAMAITIDSSENIGLGLVPTNFANRTSLDIGLGGKIWGHAAATETGHGSNFYFDGAYKRMAAVAPTRHVQDGNGHTFSVAASGAADSTITWDDALVVSPSGKVNIGSGASISPDADADNLVIQENGAAGITIGSSASSVGSIRFADSGSPRAGMIYYNHVGNEMRFYTNASERARLDSSGNLIVGSTNPAPVSNNVVGVSIRNFGEVQMSTNNQGPLYLNRKGTDGALVTLRKENVDVGSIGTVSNGLYIASPVSSDSGLRFSGSTVHPCTTSGAPRDNAIDLGYAQGRFKDLYLSGQIYNTAAYNQTTGLAANMYVNSAGRFFRSTSSERYKNSIQDATHGLTELLTLRPVTYKGNDDGDLVFGGLIAEEVHDAGLTEFVQYNEDDQPDALAYGNMVSLCIKAIQEQQATIESQAAAITDLTTRLTALENN